MHWMVSFAVFYILNESALSWKSFHHGQLSCPPSLLCLLLQSNSSLNATKQETTPSREKNTWYPIPKWRVLSSVKSNRNGYSQPYFNKQETRETDGYNFENDFSYISDLKNQKHSFERLNIKFLPLQDGYIAVKGFDRKIENNAEEYVALFVVYAHSNKKSIPESVKITEKEMLDEKENGKITCDRTDACNFSISIPFFNSSISKNISLSKDGEKFSMPILPNMSVEIKIGELDENNYTVSIMPFERFLNVTEMQTSAINVTLTKNMSMFIECNEIIPLNKSTERYFENVTESMNDATERFIDNITLSSYTADNTFKIENMYNDENTEYDDFKLLDTTLRSNIADVETADVSTPLNMFKDFSDQNSNLKAGENITYPTNDEVFHHSSNLSLTSDNFLADVSNKSLSPNNYSKESNEETDELIFLRDNSSKIGNDLNENIYHRVLKFYEVKTLNLEKLPSIATLQITINKNDNENKTKFIVDIESEKVNNSNLSEESNIRYFVKSKEILKHTSNITKRNTDDEYLSIRQNLHAKSGNNKDILISGDFISREDEISNKLLRSPNTMTLNTSEETPAEAFETMNYFPLILSKENTERRNNSSELFSNLKRHDSYSPATISNSNEEFIKKNTNRFRNKGLNQNQILKIPAAFDIAKSNRIAYEDRNKGGITLPTLIHNKDSRENHSFLKKSELQIVEGGSFDKHSSRWKRKISPGVMRLLRNDIKMSKICELEGGCNRINNVFDGMDESKYQGVREEKLRNFDSKVNLDINGMHGYRSMKDKLNIHLFSKNTNSSDSTNKQTTEKIITKHNNTMWFYPKFVNSKQKVPSNIFMQSAEVIEKKRLSFRDYVIYNSPLKKIISDINQFDSISFGPENKTNSDMSRGNNTTKIIGNKENNSTKSNIFIRNGTKLHKRLYNYEKFSRKKRSSPVFIPDFNYRNPTPKISRSNSIQFNASPYNSENFRENYEKQLRNKPIKWYPNIEFNEERFTHNFEPEYPWMIIIPNEEEHDIKKPPISKPTEQTLTDENSEKNSTNPDREIEDAGWEHNEWAWIFAVTDHPENDTTMAPENEYKPWDIINIPWYKPAINPVSTTTVPTTVPTTTTTKKPATTTRPWSTGITWESNEWKIPHNPWYNSVNTKRPWSTGITWGSNEWNYHNNPWYNSVNTTRPWSTGITWESNEWKYPNNPWYNRVNTTRPWSTGITWESNESKFPHNPWYNRAAMMMGNMPGAD